MLEDKIFRLYRAFASKHLSSTRLGAAVRLSTPPLPRAASPASTARLLLVSRHLSVAHLLASHLGHNPPALASPLEGGFPAAAAAAALCLCPRGRLHPSPLSRPTAAVPPCVGWDGAVPSVPVAPGQEGRPTGNGAAGPPTRAVTCLAAAAVTAGAPPPVLPRGGPTTFRRPPPHLTPPPMPCPPPPSAPLSPTALFLPSPASFLVPDRPPPHSARPRFFSPPTHLIAPTATTVMTAHTSCGAADTAAATAAALLAAAASTIGAIPAGSAAFFPPSGPVPVVRPRRRPAASAPALVPLAAAPPSGREQQQGRPWRRRRESLWGGSRSTARLHHTRWCGGGEPLSDTVAATAPAGDRHRRPRQRGAGRAD